MKARLTKTGLLKNISRSRDLATAKYIVADATNKQLQATMTLLEWLDKAETKEDFILFLQGIDQNKVFSTPFLNIIVLFDKYDPVKVKAVDLNLIRRRM